MMMDKSGNNIGIIIPFLEMKNFDQLDQSLLTIQGQECQPYSVYIICPMSLKTEEESLNQMLSFYQMQTSINWLLLFRDETTLSGLLNEGLEQSQERYIGFLRVGDILYPNAYHFLKMKMTVGNSVGVAFATVLISLVGEKNYFLSKRELLMSHVHYWEELYSQVALHSFLLDLDKMDRSQLFFKEQNENLMICEFLSRNDKDKGRSVSEFATLIGEKIVYSADGHVECPLEWKTDKMSEEDRKNLLYRKKKKRISRFKKGLRMLYYFEYRFLR